MCLLNKKYERVIISKFFYGLLFQLTFKEYPKFYEVVILFWFYFCFLFQVLD